MKVHIMIVQAVEKMPTVKSNFTVCDKVSK